MDIEYSGWAIIEVEVRRDSPCILAGFMSVQSLAGVAVLLVDVPSLLPAECVKDGVRATDTARAGYKEIVKLSRVMSFIPVPESTAKQVAHETRCVPSITMRLRDRIQIPVGTEYRETTT